MYSNPGEAQKAYKRLKTNNYHMKELQPLNQNVLLDINPSKEE